MKSTSDDLVGAGRERRLLGALVAAGLLLRCALALVIAPLQAPDEAAHLRYVQSLGAMARLPVQPARPSPHWEQYYQPPLAYLLFLPLERTLASAGTSPRAALRALRLQNCVYGTLSIAIGYRVAARLTPPGEFAERWCLSFSRSSPATLPTGA